MNWLNKELKDKAVSLGLCKEWQGLWNENWSPGKMADMMYKGIDFCLKNRFPSKEFIKENFDISMLRDNNIFADDKRSVNNPQQSLIIGESDVKVRYNGYGAGVIYVLDNSYVTITAKNRSFAIVHAFDKSTINAEKFDIANLVILKHSENVTVIAGDGILVKEEYDYLKD